MTAFFLKDVEKWKNINKEKGFSLFDYIFHVFKEEKINTDIYFAFLGLFWPNFIVYDNIIFLKENFSQEKFERLNKQNENVEFWINFLTIDPYKKKKNPSGVMFGGIKNP